VTTEYNHPSTALIMGGAFRFTHSPHQ